MKKKLIINAMLIHGIFVGHAYAMNVDDAKIMDAKACQLESVVKFNHDSTERWLSPACGLTDKLEVSMGHSWQRDAAGMYLSGSQLQGKTVLRELSSGGIGVGMLGGVEYQTEGLEADDSEGVRRGSWNYYSKLLTSFSLRDDTLLLHTNIGLQYTGNDQRMRMTWGLGSEMRWSEQLTFIAEVFGENKGKPSYYTGVRAVLLPERVELDLGYGNTFGRSTQDNYVVFGLRFIMPALLR